MRKQSNEGKPAGFDEYKIYRNPTSKKRKKEMSENLKNNERQEDDNLNKQYNSPSPEEEIYSDKIIFKTLDSWIAGLPVNSRITICQNGFLYNDQTNSFYLLRAKYENNI